MSEEWRCPCHGRTVAENNRIFQEESAKNDRELARGMPIVLAISGAVVAGMYFLGWLG